jgi:hypothetical protein
LPEGLGFLSGFLINNFWILKGIWAFIMSLHIKSSSSIEVKKCGGNDFVVLIEFNNCLQVSSMAALIK